eukprot:11662009-Alexandrium_andersonii.AAC.1
MHRTHTGCPISSVSEVPMHKHRELHYLECSACPAHHGHRALRTSHAANNHAAHIHSTSTGAHLHERNYTITRKHVHAHVVRNTHI